MATHQSKWNQVLGFVLVCLGVFVYLAVFTYFPLDPSLNVAGGAEEVRNAAGRIGASLSDVLLQAFGLVTLLLPIPLLVIGIKKLRCREIESPVLKSIGFAGLLVSTSCLLGLAKPILPGPENFDAGGFLGGLLAIGAKAWFNPAGSVLVASTVFLLSLTLSTQFSADAILNWFAEHRPRPIARLRMAWLRWRAARQNKQDLAAIKRDGSAVVARSLPSTDSFHAVRKTAGDSSRTEASRKSTPPAEPKADSGPPVIPPAATSRQLPFAPPESATPAPDSPQFRLPSLEFLQEASGHLEYDESELRERAERLCQKLAEFGVMGQVQQIHPGPVVTTFEFRPDPGVKYSRIPNLADDLCLALRAESIRIDRVPGKNTVGIEVPNSKRRVILLKELLDTEEFSNAKSKLALGFGKRINGETVVVDLSRMPHLLIAGSTGSGKSVGLNCMVCSILYKATPEEVRFILVDPKRVELGLYEHIPHLLTPIVTDPKKAANALRWAVREMEERYKKLAEFSVRNIAGYNEMVREARANGTGEDLEPIPYIVIIVDELADLMMTSGKEVEISVTRLAQMARAVGIHLILATQRPSVDVITGLIKANFPCRISFRVFSKVDSRTILDVNGADQLLGMGDMLYLSPETARLIRIHGAYISEKEISRIVGCLREQGEPKYQEEILIGEEEDDGEAGPVEVGEIDDKLYDEAVRFVVETRKASTSLLQRRFRVGYGRAARLLDLMEREGIVGPPDGSRPREVLVGSGYFDEIIN